MAMFILYTYNEDGLLVFFAALETDKELHQAIDNLQANGEDTYWEWEE
jgi:hypothetical protein